MEDSKTEEMIHNYMAIVRAFNEGEVPFCFKALLTVDEAAHYTGIGVNKLRVLLAENPELGLWNGNRRLVKRVKFEKFLENTSTL